MKNINSNTTRKLTKILILGIITISSSVATATIQSEAGTFFSKSPSSNTTSIISTTFRRLLAKIPDVEVNISDLPGDIRKSAAKTWGSIKKLFTSKKRLNNGNTSTTTKGNQNGNNIQTLPQSSLTTNSSNQPKKYPSRGIDKFYDGSWDNERFNYIYTGQ